MSDNDNMQHITIHKAKKPWYKRIWLWIGVIVLLLIIGGAASSSTKNTPTTSVPAPSTNQSTSTPAPAAPQTLLDITGNGSKQTEKFTAAGDWTLTYTYDCTSFGYAGNFAAEIMNGDGSLNTDTAPNDQGMKGGNTDNYYDAGSHYLAINSECSWHVTVKG